MEEKKKRKLTLWAIGLSWVATATFMGLFIYYILEYNDVNDALKILKLKSETNAVISEFVEPEAFANGDGKIFKPRDNSPTGDVDWQSQIFYFLMIDRFNDGDSSNNDQGVGEVDPTSDQHNQGGDLQGIIDKLDYIQGLGATAVWITPPTANQWWDKYLGWGGYHGYWARDLEKIDEHWGYIEKYKELADKLHERGMYLFQDIVTNHTGNYFTYPDRESYDPADPCKGYHKIEDPLFFDQELPYPLSENDCVADGTGMYHFTPTIMDGGTKDEEVLFNYQLGDLDDLNTSHKDVRAYLKRSYGKWVREVGVDGFRIDTVRYVEYDFWDDFMNNPVDGILAVARTVGKSNFWAFGEVSDTSKPYSDEGEKFISRWYGGTVDALPHGVESLLHFPMYQTLTDVFAYGQPPDILRHRVELQFETFKKPHANPFLMPTFIDNHDRARFLARGSLEGMRLALSAIMTLPGVPVIYYGTEQNFTGMRDAMFKGGYRGDGLSVDSFNDDTDTYLLIKELSELRKAEKSLTYGDFQILFADDKKAGKLGYLRTWNHEQMLVLFNTSSSDIFLNETTILNPGVQFRREHLDQIRCPGTTAAMDTLTIGSNGKLTIQLPAYCVIVYKRLSQVSTGGSDEDLIVITSTPSHTIENDVKVLGTATANALLTFVINDDISKATIVKVSDKGDWEANILIKQLGPGLVENHYAVYDEAEGWATDNVIFLSDQVWILRKVCDVVPTREGDNGLHLPNDASFDHSNPQVSFDEIKWYTAGNNIKLEVQMLSLTDTWLPPNGFDHSGFTIFWSNPELSADSVDFYPQMNMSAVKDPWARETIIMGWGSTTYSTEGASATTRGQIMLPPPQVTVDKDSRTITITVLADILHPVSSVSDIKWDLHSWDFDGEAGGYRPLSMEKNDWSFWGKDPSTTPISWQRATSDECLAAP